MGKINSYKIARNMLEHFRIDTMRNLDMRFDFENYIKLEKHMKDKLFVVDLQSSELSENNMAYKKCFDSCFEMLEKWYKNGFLKE